MKKVICHEWSPNYRRTLASPVRCSKERLELVINWIKAQGGQLKYVYISYWFQQEIYEWLTMTAIWRGIIHITITLVDPTWKLGEVSFNYRLPNWQPEEQSLRPRNHEINIDIFLYEASDIAWFTRLKNLHPTLEPSPSADRKHFLPLGGTEWLRCNWIELQQG